MLLLTNRCDYSAWSHLLLLLPTAAWKQVCRYVDNKKASDVLLAELLILLDLLRYCVACSSRLYGGVDFIDDIGCMRKCSTNNSSITHRSTSIIGSGCRRKTYKSWPNFAELNIIMSPEKWPPSERGDNEHEKKLIQRATARTGSNSRHVFLFVHCPAFETPRNLLMALALLHDA